MSDQSFSVKNFRKIYDLDKKNKGILEKKYFNEAYKIRLKTYNLKKIYRRLNKRSKMGLLSQSFFERKSAVLKEHIVLRTDQLNEEINSKLKGISIIVSAKGYSLPLTKSSFTVGNKDVYSIGDGVESLFVSRQVHSILNGLYKLKVNNRDLIISRLSCFCKDLSPKYIIRADVESFYESIDHKILLDSLHSSPKLSLTAKRVLTQLIRSYARITSRKKGLPRGVGISAFLSEVYMSNIDAEINSLTEVTYYERYVDDIIVVFSPRRGDSSSSYLPNIEKIINKRKLELNKEKTVPVDVYSNDNGSFEYLGYKFELSKSYCKIKLSYNRKERIKKRVNDVFDKYNREKIKTPSRAARSLILKIKFLTGNTRLHNSKSKAFVGIYFSNKYITETSDLVGLDSYLKSKCNQLIDPKLKKNIRKLSFVDGFEGMVFRRFSIKELTDISKAWVND